MKMNSAEKEVHDWLFKTVIGLNLCPFAKKPYNEGQIRIKSTNKKNKKEQIDFFLDELNTLQQSQNLTTSLVIFENATKDFFKFYEFEQNLSDMLYELSLEETFQLVSFHPKFIFEQEDKNSLAHYVNRSPLPLIHILRSKDIALALEESKDAEALSFRNQKKIENLSAQELRYYFPFLKDIK
ncbi:MAG: DUF1415 family protein [Bacteriovoracaceae bacterium]|jgi:hypothetical protein|nr:DUF1415 family protein [Bacteriovoracaceae bacterium]|tara:strand:+ start:554 stop:1102 length:549 start_codon:yes stop_codon:yes gene_type:complete